MTIKLRTAHRIIWLVLAVALLVGVVAGLQLQTLWQ
jgi:hypothetical protein